MESSASSVITNDEYAVLCGAIFICLLLCSIFTLAGAVSRSANTETTREPSRLPAFGANTSRSCTCCPGGISDGLCAARQSVARMSMDRGARPSMDAHAGGAMAKARMSMDRAARPSDASAGGRQGRQAVSAAAHRKAPVLPARRGADPGGRATAEHADAPTAESREGLQQRRSRIARYSSGAEYGLGPDSALVRSERSEVLSVAALTALRYSCTSASFTTTTKDFHCNQGKAAAERQPLQRKAGAAAAAAAVPSMGNRAISAPIPLADPLAAPPSSAAPFQPTSSRTAAAALLAAARSSGGRYSRASDADSEASYARRSNSSGNGNGNGNNGRQVDTEFLMRLDEALSSGALRPDQATRLLRDVGFDLDQLLVDELSSK